MRDANSVPVAATTQVARAANTSPQNVERVIADLEREGRISPERSPSGRTYLSVADFQTVWAALWARRRPI